MATLTPINEEKRKVTLRPVPAQGDDLALHPAFDEQAAQDEMTGIASHLAFGADPKTASTHAAAVRDSLSKDANAQATFDGAHTFAREVSTIIPAKPTTFRPNLAPLGIVEPTSRQRVERVGKAYVEAGIISQQELDDTLSKEKTDQLPWWMEQPRPRFYYHKSLEQEINDTPKTIGATGLAMVQGFYGSVAAISGNSVVGEGARELVKKIDRAIQRTAPERGSFYQDVVGGFTSMAVFMAPGVATEKAVGLAGLEMAGWVSRATHASMMAATEAQFEAGDAYNQKYKETGSHDEARRSAAIVFFSNLPLLAVTNYLGVAAAKGTKITQLSGLQRAAQTGKSAAFEGAQESAQAVIQDVGLGKPIDTGDALYQGLIGAIVGGGITAVEESLQAINQAKTVPPEVEQLYTSEVEANLAQGMEPEQAHIEATRAIAKTPEGEQYLETVANAFEASLKAEAAIGQAEEDLNVPRGTFDDVFETLINQELGTGTAERVTYDEDIINESIDSIINERYPTEESRAGVDIELEREIIRDALSTDIQELLNPPEVSPEIQREVEQSLSNVENLLDEEGKFYVPSPEELKAIGERIKEAVNDPAQAFRDIAEIGKQIFNDGVTDLKTFTARMSETIGKGWEAFKDVIQRAWTALKAFNSRLGEAGMVEAYHGSPHKFDRFSLDKIGTGEGAQAFGWGLYFTDAKEIAKYYSNAGVSGDLLVMRLQDGTEVIGDDLTDDMLSAAHYAELGEKDAGQFKHNANRFAIKRAESEGANKAVIDILKKSPTFKYERPKKRVYKVSLHKGKDPSEYDYLRWDEQITEAQTNKILDQAEKENPQIAARLAAAFEIPKFEIEKSATGKTWQVVLFDNVYDSKLKTKKAAEESKASLLKAYTKRGQHAYFELRSEFLSDKEASLFLLRAGIDGIKYPAGTLSGAKSEAFNYVVFDENAITIEDVESGRIYIPSREEIAGIINTIKQKVQNPSEAFADLVNLGNSIYQDGITDLKNFTARMSAALGETWEAFKHLVSQVWESVKAFNTSLGERGAVGPFKNDRGAKKRIREITGQATPEQLRRYIREDVALEAAFTKAAQAARKAMSEGNKEGIAKERARMREIIDRAASARQDRADRRKMISNLKKVRRKLPQMPSEFARPIKEFIDSINLTNLSEAKRSSLLEIKQMLESNDFEAENVLSRQEMAELDRLGRSNVKDFTTDELRQIHDAVMHFATLASEYKKLRLANQKVELAAVLTMIDKELRPAKEFEGNIIRTQKSKTRKAIEKAGRAVDLFVHEQKAPDALLEAMAGRDSVLYRVLFKQVNQGSKNALAYRQRTQDAFHDSLEGFAKRNNIKNVMKWLQDKVTVRLGGEKVIEMTRDERMSFYRHSLNPDNRTAMINEKGGVGFKSSEQFKNTPLKITEVELNAIVQSMTQAELEFAGEPVKALFDEQGLELANIYKEKNGLDLETLEDYFPKEVLPREREAGDVDTDFEAEKFANKFLRIGIEKGMTKARINSRKAVYISGLTYEINKSINRAASYIGLELPISNAARLYYNKDFQNMIDSRYGEKTRKFIEKYLRDVAGEMRNYDAVESAANAIKNNLSVAYLGISPFVMAKQVASLPLYSVYIEPQYLLEGVIQAGMHPIETKERHAANSPYYRSRLAGSSERDVADVFKSNALRNLIPDSGKTLKEWAMSGIQLFDLAAVTPGMEGGVQKVLTEMENGKLSGIVKETLNITDDDIKDMPAARRMELAYEFAEWVTEKTQPQFAPQFRSQISRGSALAKMVTMFGSFTNRAYNLLGSTYANAKRTGSTQDWGIFARSAFTVLVLNTMIVMAIDRLRDELYGRESEDAVRSILKSWSGYVFIMRDIVQAILTEGYFGGEFEVPVQSWLQGGIDSGRYFVKYLEDGKESDLEKSMNKGLEFILSGFGVPYRMLKKLIVPPKQRRS